MVPTHLYIVYDNKEDDSSRKGGNFFGYLDGGGDNEDGIDSDDGDGIGDDSNDCGDIGDDDIVYQNHNEYNDDHHNYGDNVYSISDG